MTFYILGNKKVKIMSYYYIIKDQNCQKFSKNIDIRNSQSYHVKKYFVGGTVTNL